MKAYSMDLRHRVLAACDGGERTAAVAARFGVSPAWVRRLKQFRRELGIVGPRPISGRGPAKIDRGRPRALVGGRPDATLAELRDAPARGSGVACSISAVFKAPGGLRLTHKKSRPAPPSGAAATSPGAARGGTRTWPACRRRS